MYNKDCEIVNQNITKKINKIKGQLNGIDQMIKNKRDCAEIINLIQAVRSALAKVAQDILILESKQCLESKSNVKKINDLKIIVEKLFTII